MIKLLPQVLGKSATGSNAVDREKKQYKGGAVGSRKKMGRSKL